MRSPLKQNERVLSSQAINVGRSLEVNSIMEKLTFDSNVGAYHVCKDVWKPAMAKYILQNRSLMMQSTNLQNNSDEQLLCGFLYSRKPKRTFFIDNRGFTDGYIIVSKSMPEL